MWVIKVLFMYLKIAINKIFSVTVNHIDNHVNFLLFFLIILFQFAVYFATLIVKALTHCSSEFKRLKVPLNFPPTERALLER